MKTKIHSLARSLLGVTAALLVPFLAAAQTGPSGSSTYMVTGPANAVWDFGGLLTNVHISISTDGGNLDISFPVVIQQSGAGKVSGSALNTTVNLNDSGDITTFPGTVKSSGTVTSTGPGAHVMFKSTVTGTAILPGDSTPRKVSASLQINGVIDNTNRTISGQSQAKASAQGVGSTSETDNFGPTSVNSIEGIAPLGDGTWELAMTVSTVANKITGSAQVTLNSGQVFNYTVKGSFKSSTGLSKLKLSASDDTTKGSTLQVSMNGNSVQNIKGRIAGQNVNANF